METRNVQIYDPPSFMLCLMMCQLWDGGVNQHRHLGSRWPGEGWGAGCTDLGSLKIATFWGSCYNLLKTSMHTLMIIRQAPSEIPQDIPR